MNKKILDVTVTFLFSICLIVAANIQEESAASDAGAIRSESQYMTAMENDNGMAGVSYIFSEYSFTTESGEKAIITKKENYRVTTPGMSNEGNARNPEMDEVQQAAGVQQTAETTQTAEVQQTAETTQTEEHKYTNRWDIVLTDEEIDLLARIVWLESNGEPVNGQEAVVEVIFNRMASELYPNTLYDVLSQKNPTQFCSWKSRERAKPTDKEYQSIYNVLNGNTNILRDDTLYFSREPLTSRLDVRIGGHSFCY